MLLPPRTRPVAHITAPGAFGGLERVVAGLATGLARCGESVVVVAVLEPEVAVPPWLEGLGGSGVVVEVLRVGARAYGKERAAVRAILDRHGVRVVHTHGYRADLVHTGAARHDGRIAVSTVHGFTGNGWKGRAYEWMQLRVLRRASAVVAVSSPLLDALVRSGIPRDRIALIPNGIDASGVELRARSDARRRLGLPDGARVMGWVGRLSPEKDPLFAIEAWGRVSDGTARLCIIGDGPLRSACEARARELGLGDRVRFVGAVPDAGRLLRAFDGLMLTSRTEGTPMVLLEAGVAGVPIVATAVGGVPDLLGPEGGLLVAHGDADALAAAAARVLSEPDAPARRAATLQARLTTEKAGTDWIAAHRALYDALAARG